MVQFQYLNDKIISDDATDIFQYCFRKFNINPVRLKLIWCNRFLTAQIVFIYN